MYQLYGARSSTCSIVTDDPLTKFSKPSFWIAIEASISCMFALTDATQVVSGPSISSVFFSLRS